MKKVFFYTDTPIFGGAERQMLLLAQNLHKEKYIPSLICSSYESLEPMIEAWKNSGFNVYKLNVAHKHDPRHYFEIKKLLKTESPDLLHIHLWNPGSCRYAFLATPENIPIITTEHDPFPLKGMKKALKITYLRKTSETITVSDSNKELMISEYPEFEKDITTVHNGIDLDFFEKSIVHMTSQEKNKIRHHVFKANQNDRIILSIAALHPRKGLTYLLEAMPDVLEKFPDAKLAIIGEGPQKKELQKVINQLKIDNRVMLLGYQEDIPKLLKCVEIFVLPSVTEAFGLVLLEAMAAQLPILSTKTGGIPEIIQHMKTGLLVEPANTQELKDGLNELLRNTALSQKIAFVGLHHVKEFSASLMAEKTEAVYDKVLSVNSK
jgi:glycosyltransferase involved in cell wall biosynthesis